MDRREFLKTIACGGMAALLSSTLRPLEAIGASSQNVAGASYPQLVAVRGGSPDALFDRGIEALGGIKQFVRKGQNVLIKPNMAWAVGPDTAGNTNPLLLKRVIEQCLAAGARRVSVFDHTCDEWRSAYSTSGLEKTAKDAGAAVAPGHVEGNYQEVSINGPTLKKAKVHELYLSSDVIINLPVLKHHSGAGMTAAMKNLMGVVWDRYDYHREGLSDCIADFCAFRRPTLNVVDAYKVMLTGGPRGSAASKYAMSKMLILSTDIVAADCAAAKTFGTEPSKLEYIARALKNGTGSPLDKIKIQRITL